MGKSIINQTLDVDWYARTYAKQIPKGTDPQVHWAMHGSGKGFFPNAALRNFSTALHNFDESWYLAEYEDVRNSGLSALYHYIVYGMNEGRKKNLDEARLSLFADPNFDSDWYISRYADVAAGKLDPIEHYIIHGRAEGRAPNASAAAYMAATFYTPLISLMFTRLIGRDPSNDEEKIWVEKLLDGYGSTNFIRHLAISPDGMQYHKDCQSIRSGR